MTNAICPPAAETTTPEPILRWIHPRGWKADNRTRKYITLAERNYSRENDFDVLRRSVQAMLRQQDARGSFYSDEEYLLGDIVDDQMGGAAMLAYFLARTGPDDRIQQALEKAVRFFLDQLVYRSLERPFRFARYFNDRDTGGDWCNTLWCLGSSNTVLRYGKLFLTESTLTELREVMADFWSFVSTYPMRDENPCHNQLLAYCEIGIVYAKTIGKEALVLELLDFYHTHLRRLRIWDRGHPIFSEFNQWDSHYGVLSWMFLELLFVETGAPAFAEDAEQMALYFNEQLSAGGYCWGGSRNNESGIDEFPHLFTARQKEFGFERVLFPEPSHLWHRMVIGGHGGGGCSGRLEAILPSPETKRVLAPTAWHFQKENASVCLSDDHKLHHLSAGGLELIPVAGTGGLGSGMRWLEQAKWKQDLLQIHPPRSSDGLRFHDAKPFQAGTIVGLSSMQRGYLWETRQWWITAGKGILWIAQLTPHAFPQCSEIEFLLGTPILTRLAGRPVPVSEVESAEGTKADTQGTAVTISSRKYLRFGDNFVGATAPLEFIRPADDAFHTFPLPAGRLWRDASSSNQLRIRVSQEPQRCELRQSLFFAAQFDDEIPSLNVQATPKMWTVSSKSKSFQARLDNGLWHYSITSGSSTSQLPPIGFGAK